MSAPISTPVKEKARGGCVLARELSARQAGALHQLLLDNLGSLAVKCLQERGRGYFLVVPQVKTASLGLFITAAGLVRGFVAGCHATNPHTTATAL